MTENIHNKFRPSARLISTIGDEIIKDMHAAIVEIVKNAYDADANNVIIRFNFSTKNKNLIIEIIDDGHGMSKSTIEEKWLVPSTNDKLIRKISPKGRVMQGRKGIGRFATAILGDILELESNFNNIKTILHLNWADFTEDKFLDEIDINITCDETSDSNGTIFRIIGFDEKFEQWNENEFDNLIKELRKLLTPINKNHDVSQTYEIQEFKIELEISNCETTKYSNKNIVVEPFPLLDYFDYRLFGEVNSKGFGVLNYINSAIGDQVSEKIEYQYELNENQKFCGELYLDIRVFDRDPEAIEKLVENSFILNHDSEKLGRNEAKRLLDQISGINIYRNGFRIRPYGDPGYDWLDLDKKRVQDPSYKVGSNQVSGYVQIQNEEYSNLIEKSARDGLKETPYYFGLQEILRQTLLKVENNRYSFRKKVGKGRKFVFLDSKLEKLVDQSSVKSEIISILSKSNITDTNLEQVEKLIDNSIIDKRAVALDIQKSIAIYEGHATLGKIMNVILHEARKPLAWFKNQSKIINLTYSRYLKTKDPHALKKMNIIISESIDEANILIQLFERLNPLAVKSRGNIKDFNILKIIKESIRIFEGIIADKKITIQLNCSDKIFFNGWKEDIYIALTNILENSVYWVSKEQNDKIISIDVWSDENKIYISIKDNGPGIDKEMILTGSIFEPGISTKPNQEGTGLGLAIAGEAISRNNGDIKAVEVIHGACFIIELPKGGI